MYGIRGIEKGDPCLVGRVGPGEYLMNLAIYKTLR